jgi:hypothetical protein
MLVVGGRHRVATELPIASDLHRSQCDLCGEMSREMNGAKPALQRADRLGLCG